MVEKVIVPNKTHTLIRFSYTVYMYIFCGIEKKKSKKKNLKKNYFPKII